MSTLIELRPNRDLLDANFDGYKLSLEPVPIYQSNLKSDVDHILPSDDQYSFLHVKVFGLHNHLYGDPWSTDDVYYIDDKWCIQRNVSAANPKRSYWSEVWRIPSLSQRESSPGRYNASLGFASARLAVVSDGAGTLHLLDMGGDERWRLLYSGQVCGADTGFVIVDARLESSSVHCLLEHVNETKIGGATVQQHFKTILEWVTLAEGEGGESWSMGSVRKLSGAGGADYAAFEPGCRCVYVASDKRFDFIVDSEKAVEMRSPLEPDESSRRYFVSWMQTGSEVTVWVPTPPGGSERGEVGVTVGEGSLEVTCRGVALITGHTWQRLDVSRPPVWTVDQNNVELKLYKAEPGVHWLELIKEAVDIEEIVRDPSLMDEGRVSTNQVEDEAASSSPGFNSEQLEECDSLPDISQLMRLDTHSHAVTHQINLGGHQWLFNARIDPESAPAICLRFDVDGCVWRVAPPVGDCGSWPCVHMGTFLAFGYVQASKTQRKFTVCSPDMSYVAICDARRHVYIYRQPMAVQGELRNRKSGRNVERSARQQLATLESDDEVLGSHASNMALYVLTARKLYVLQVNA